MGWAATKFEGGKLQKRKQCEGDWWLVEGQGEREGEWESETPGNLKPETHPPAITLFAFFKKSEAKMNSFSSGLAALRISLFVPFHWQRP